MSTAEKGVDTAQRLDNHIVNHPAPAPDLTSRVEALETLTGSGTMSDKGAVVDTGSLSNGWGKNGGVGYLKYQRIGRLCFIYCRDLAPGTVADNTEICSAANGLPSSCRPNSAVALAANTNAIKQNGSSWEMAALHFMADGSIQCTGFHLSCTFADCYGSFYIDA